jgi:hypothetical protein
MFQTKVIEKIKTHPLYFVTFTENRTVYEKIWKNMADPDRPRITIMQCMLIACQITKATNTHSEYVKLIAFPRQQWLRERASLLC